MIIIVKLNIRRRVEVMTFRHILILIMAVCMVVMFFYQPFLYGLIVAGLILAISDKLEEASDDKS